MRDEDDANTFEKPSLWLSGLVDGVTGAILLATIAAVYALLVDTWM